METDNNFVNAAEEFLETLEAFHKSEDDFTNACLGVSSHKPSGKSAIRTTSEFMMSDLEALYESYSDIFDAFEYDLNFDDANEHYELLNDGKTDDCEELGNLTVGAYDAVIELLNDIKLLLYNSHAVTSIIAESKSILKIVKDYQESDKGNSEPLRQAYNEKMQIIDTSLDSILIRGVSSELYSNISKFEVMDIISLADTIDNQGNIPMLAGLIETFEKEQERMLILKEHLTT